MKHEECNYNNTLTEHNLFATTTKKPAGVVEVPANKDALKQALSLGPVMGKRLCAAACECHDIDVCQCTRLY